MAFQVEGVVFDLDGTLLDAEPLYEKADVDLVAEYGHELNWEVRHHIIGKPEKVGARIIIDAFSLPLSEEEYLQKRGETLHKLFPDAQPMPFAVEVVRHLAEVCKLPCAIATSSWRHNLKLKRMKNGALFDPMQAIICGDDEVVKRGKPHPDIFLAAASAIGIDPKKCIAFEDSPSGVEAAHRAGMRVYAVPDERMERSLFEKADEILSSLREFKPESLGLPSF